MKVAVRHLLGMAFSACGGFQVMRLFSRRTVTIVMYHRIIPDNTSGVSSYLAVRQSQLREQIQFFKNHFTITTLDEAVERLRTNRVDKRYLVITFDDGYRDNLTLGLPVFQEERVRPTIFVVTGCVDSGSPLWPDIVRKCIYDTPWEAPVRLTTPPMTVEHTDRSRIAAVNKLITYLKRLDTAHRERYLNHLCTLFSTPATSDGLMLHWNEVTELDRHRVQIGSHTVHHTILTRISLTHAIRELTSSKAEIEEKSAVHPTCFAYPNGGRSDFDNALEAEVMRAGYNAAVTTVRGVNRAGDDLYRLKRVCICLSDSIEDIKLRIGILSLF